ncbi:UPF0187-domain-containing protein [Sodiomyces alkalinus F11]|uniref:UPF0187-domain-containing protein n=1 Tax=Sodiomyces alkalinus (strain CBS 110278 / VKM F-3762 / F11) TaxID=1314773 RepID=A0A3N2PTF6_SODAK|nr:UPF0187-domain-containing protein [Sodiomyces alkalinus F11]ROT37792.1 UPF0187-domain-containing protein [Sodiomyces alkalinus F11]
MSEEGGLPNHSGGRGVTSEKRTEKDENNTQTTSENNTQNQSQNEKDKEMHRKLATLEPLQPPKEPQTTVHVFDIASPALPPTSLNYFSRDDTTMELGDYFTGPRDIQKHSKWPLFLQIHGSILPKVVLPLTILSLWAAAVTTVSELVHELGVRSILLTVLGFVVALGLSFRSSTAYERYSEGRRYWAQLILATQTLARVIWVHTKDHPDLPRKQSTLRRISCLNLLLAFAVALKHKLRFEPYTAYDDLQHLVAHLDTLARAATEADPDAATTAPQKSFYKEVGEYLGLAFAESNPRKRIKKASRPLGNLPLEILSHLSVLIDATVDAGQLPTPMHQTLAYNNLTVLNDILTGTDRVLTTPLPIAYNIAIAQITYLYVFLLPFQLHRDLGWITIPASLAAAYIILGFLLIGRELENPFGHDVNDLPLEAYCQQIAQELDVIASMDVPRRDPYGVLVENAKNLPLYPVSMASWDTWARRPEANICDVIRRKPDILFQSRKKTDEERASARARDEPLGRSRTREQGSASSGTLHGDHHV